MFTPSDLEQLKHKNISVATVEQQLTSFVQGFPYLNIKRVAAIGEGLLQLTESELEVAIETWYKGDYIKLSDFRGIENQPIKTREAIANPNVNFRYSTSQQDFHKIPGSPIAYWVSDRVKEIFEKSEK